MFSIYLSCLVLGGSFTILSAFGHLRDRASSDLAKNGPLYSLRSLVYSLVGFGGVGVLLSSVTSGLSPGMNLTFAVLSGLLVGGTTSAVLAFLARPTTGGGRTTEGT
ncbi:MAG: hypothetical protein OEU54_16115 [Gemmatimonadota bacterium]|nr:hypothetical protein [Gemmatimonadota bacterium]